MYNEEQKVYYNGLLELQENEDVIRLYNRIPYQLIRYEKGVGAEEFISELGRICFYYKVYRMGKEFNVEGTNGDYVPAQLKYKMTASLINKQARFLFAEHPTISIEPKGDLSENTPDVKRRLTIMSDLVKTVFDKNKFQDILLKGAKDCFIGKRVACLVNFNEDDGITITFLNSLQFMYETKMSDTNFITKFVCFIVTKDCTNLVDRRIFKKKYEYDEETKKVYLEEVLYDGTCKEIEVITPRQEIKLDFIPVSIFINDGLSGELNGESEVELLYDYEKWYSKLSNADSDAQRKSMNPTKFVVDMDSNSTKNLSTAAGSLWDLGSDQNLAESHPEVGLLEPKMSYSEALKTSLDRIKTSGYEQVDIPNITLDTLSGVITSGKALKAVYWPLIVRCKEKMNIWGPGIRNIVDIIIKGAIIYPNCVKMYTSDIVEQEVYEVDIKQNTPLPEDEIEEKTTDLAEVESQVMSRKSYMKKWRGLTESEVSDELEQIAYERQILEESSFNNGMNGDNNLINAGEEDFNAAGVNAINKDGTQNNTNSNNLQTNSNLDTENTDVEREIAKLNGSQISSLIHILNNYRSGGFTRNQAISLIRSMGLDEEFAIAILEEEKNKVGV